jgi:S1-C subfamily serine protease
MIGVGFDQVENSSSMFMYYYNVKPGLYVTSLTEGYNDSVLQVGDRVIAVNGEEVTTVADVKAIVSAASVGDILKFQLYRDGKLIGVEVTCYEKVPDGKQSADIQFEAQQP